MVASAQTLTFDTLLARAALVGVAAGTVWMVLILAAVGAEACSQGRVRFAAALGCPRWLHRSLLGLASAAFSAAMITPPPAVADAPEAPVSGDLNGLALPDRPAGTMPPQNQSSTDPLRARARAPASVSAWVTVRAGQSLWEISRGRLPADATPDQIAALTRSIHHCNRRTIGHDPDLIRPGQRLAIPHPPHETYSEDS